MLFVNGLGFPFYFDVDKIKETINFKAKANDIFIVRVFSLFPLTFTDIPDISFLLKSFLDTFE